MDEQTYQLVQSLKKEYVELKTKIASAEFTVETCQLDGKAHELLAEQVEAMKLYAEIVMKRANLLAGTEAEDGE